MTMATEHSDSDVDLTVEPMERRLLKVTHKERKVCPDHGPFAAYFTERLPEGSNCPECAAIRQREADRIEAEEKSRQYAADRLSQKLGGAMIPPRFRGKTFESFLAADARQQKVLGVCRDYAVNFPKHHADGRSLLLLGNVGTGKTHLAAAIADYVIRNHGLNALYRTVYSILQHVKGSFDREASYSESEAFRDFIQPELLVIDEVGATKSSEFEQQTLFNIINGRYEQQLPTIVISNLAPDELGAALGERCVDRLREGGGIAQVFSWGSARKTVKIESDFNQSSGTEPGKESGE